MNETMKSRLERLLSEEIGVRRIDFLTKCKTKDGMIYTLEVTENHKEQAPKEIPYADWVESNAVSALLHFTDLVAHENGYQMSLHELVTIKNSEIVRVWVELGDCYVDGPIIQEK